MTGNGMPFHGAHVSIKIGFLVQVLTADHPRDPALRRQGYERGIPVNIGGILWIGSGTIVLPGVTIGDDAIVGTGSVAMQDVPASATAIGNPADVATRYELLTDGRGKILKEAEFGRLWLAEHYFCHYGFQ